MLNTFKFNTHLKAIHNDPECPLLLFHLNNDFKKFDTRNVLPYALEHVLRCLKIMKLRHFFLKVHRFMETRLEIDLK